jgi:hypothetical protein
MIDREKTIEYATKSFENGISEIACGEGVNFKNCGVGLRDREAALIIISNVYFELSN